MSSFQMLKRMQGKRVDPLVFMYYTVSWKPEVCARVDSVHVGRWDNPPSCPPFPLRLSGGGHDLWAEPEGRGHGGRKAISLAG